MYFEIASRKIMLVYRTSLSAKNSVYNIDKEIRLSIAY